MNRTLGILAATAAAITSLAGASLAASVKDGYATPIVTIPYAVTKPTIDGVVNDKEWQGAASVNALQTTNHAISPRQTRFFLMWDEDNIYLAMRSPMRKGERIIQGSRQTDKDINVVFDDSYEIWIDVGTKTPDGQPTFFQYLANFAGARYDVLQEPAVGNSRTGWTAGWQPKNRISPDGAWEMEVAIPRKSIYKNTPFADGDKIACLIARNYKRPWEQNSFEGTGIFNVRETYSHFTLSKSASAIHLLAAADPEKGTLGLALEAFGARDEDINWSFASDGGVTKEGKLSVKKGQMAQLPAMLDLDKPGSGSYRIRVSSADSKTPLLDWCANRGFGDLSALKQTIDDKGDKVALTLSFNPVGNYVRVSGDFIDYDARATIDRCVVTVTDSDGKQLALQNLKIDDLAYVNGVIKLGDLGYGDYKTTLTCYGVGDKEILSREQKFTKKDHAASFPWWNTTAGNIEKVIDPWTPVTFKDGKIDVWGREMQIGTAGLPAQITTQKEDLLAGPAQLVMVTSAGHVVQPAPGRPKTTLAAEHRAIVEQNTKFDDLDVRSTTTIEFDGMYKVDLLIVPQRSIKLSSLKVVVPLKNETADYIHATGEGIRYGFYYGSLDKTGTGRIWDSTKVDSQPMIVGSFIPYLWIGNPKGGVAWFADSDEGWDPNNHTPAIEVRRDGKSSTDLVLNLVSSDSTFDRPRKITFAFQASPVKPMAEKWRMDPWWCGDTFRDFSCHPDGDIIWTAMPFTMNTEKCKEMVETQHKATAGFGVDKYKATATPYFIQVSLPGQYIPEVNYFGDEWKTSVSGGLCYGKTLTDYMIYNLSKWCKETGIDGYYLDNVSPQACDNIDAGRGYRLPGGKIQPTYQMFDTRKYFLRMRAAFEEQGKNPPHIVVHMTNNMIIPWVGAADVAYDGEEHVIYPEMGKDFMDFWSLDRLRADYSGQWGVAVNFMHEYQGDWWSQKGSLKKVMRAYTGEVILQDALPSGNSNGMNPEVWQARDKFGIEANDVRFIGYWQENSGLSTDAKDVKLAGWLRPGKILVAVVNFGEKCSAKVKLDETKLGLPTSSQWKAYDAETMETLSVGRDGSVTLPIDRHDYRQIVVEGVGS